MEIGIKYNEHSISNPLISNIIDLKDLDTLECVCNTIFIGDLLNFLDPQDIIPILLKIKSKLITQGLIVIEEFDAFEICSAIVNDRLLSTDLNNIIRPRKQIYAIYDIMELSQKIGLKIISKDIDNYKHYIEIQNG